MSLKLGMIRGAATLSAARIAINLLSAASIVILARLLTPDDFGIVAIASAVLSVVISVTELYFFQALIQQQEVSRGEINSAWTLSLLRAVAVIAFCAAIAWPLAWAFSEPRLVPVFVIAGVTGAFMGFHNPLISLATRDMSFGPLVIFQICQKGVGLVLAIVLALNFGNYWSIIIGNCVGAVLASLVSYFLIPYWPRLNFAHFGKIWGFSSWMFLNQLCETIGWRFDQLAIGLVLPGRLLGIYAVADNLAVIPSRELSVPLNIALFSGMSAINGDMPRLRRSYLSAQATLAMVTLPLVIGLALVAGPVVRVVLGEQWLECTPYVALLALGYAIASLNTSLRPMAMALGQTRLVFERELWILLVKVPLILTGLLSAGLLGVALGSLVAAVLGCAISYRFSTRLIGLSLAEQLRSHGLTFAGLAAMAATLLGLQELTGMVKSLGDLVALAVLVAAGGLAYVGTVLALWRMKGKPDGAVVEVAQIAERLLGVARLRTKPAA